MQRRSFIQCLCVVVLVCGLSVLAACGKTASPVGGNTINLDPNPPGPEPFGPVTTELNLYPTGTFPNRIVTKGNDAFIVNSGSNSIERINLATSVVTQPFITLPSGANPYDMTILGNSAYITNFVANTVSVADLTTGNVTATISGSASGIFNEPEGIAVAENGLIFVANADFDPSFNQGPGFVTVIDSATNQVVNQIPTTQKNPQYVTIRGNTVYVVNSGSGTFDLGCGCFRPTTDGGIDVIDAIGAATASAPNQNLPVALDISQPLLGFPGSLAITSDGATGYMGSNAGIIYKVNLSTLTLVRGNSNPIVVTPDPSNNLVTIRIDSKGLRWVINFNQDRAHLLDSSNDALVNPFISLDADTGNLEGPTDFAFHADGIYPDVYVIMGLSEQVSAIYTN